MLTIDAVFDYNSRRRIQAYRMAFTPMSAYHARAYAMALQLHRLLGELCDLPEHGPGSALDDAWNRMDDVVEMLEPRDFENPVDA